MEVKFIAIYQFLILAIDVLTYTSFKSSTRAIYLPRLTKITEDIFGSVFTVQLLLMAPVLAIDFYTYTMSDTQSDIRIQYLIAEAVFLLPQIFFYCWFGNEVTSKVKTFKCKCCDQKFFRIKYFIVLEYLIHNCFIHKKNYWTDPSLQMNVSES